MQRYRISDVNNVILELNAELPGRQMKGTHRILLLMLIQRKTHNKNLHDPVGLEPVQRYNSTKAQKQMKCFHIKIY